MILLISGFAVALIAAYLLARYMGKQGIERGYTCNVKGEG